MQLRSLVGDECRFHVASIMPELAALDQLTILELASNIIDGRVLPAGLQALTVADISDMAPVLRLVQLTALELNNSKIQQPEHLQQLSALKRLERLERLSVGVAECRPLVAVPVMAACCTLPLTCLRVAGGALTVESLAQLGRACTGMTRLELFRYTESFESLLAGSLADPLSRMTALERLACIASSTVALHSRTRVYKVVAGLPRLMDLTVNRQLGANLASRDWIMQM